MSLRHNIKTLYSQWELLPTEIMFIPVIIYVLFLGIRHRNMSFFSNINGKKGLVIEMDKNIFLEHIPDVYKPKSIIIKPGQDISQIKFSFPCIVKPNEGCRGIGVKKLSSKDEWQMYHHNAIQAYLIQEFIGYDIELGVFVIKNIPQNHTTIVGVVQKEFATVVGDGVSTLQELIKNHKRAKRFYKNFYERNKKDRDTVLPLGQSFTITDLGNHAQGAICKDVSHLITTQNTQLFNMIGDTIGNIEYGRYDLKCKSFEDFKQGKNIKMLEFNGIKAEPLHLYDANIGPIQAYNIRFGYLRKMMSISQENKKKGNYPLGFKKAIQTIIHQFQSLNALKKE